METMGNIILLAGKSGSGKSSVAEYLGKKYGLRQVLSYTTRPKRGPEDNTHIFLSNAEFDKIKKEDMVAYTEFAGYRYCATQEMVDKADIYVIDPDGILTFKKRYTGMNVAIPIYLNVTKRERFRRMLNRGDSVEMAEKRIINDDEKFSSIMECHPITINATHKTVEEVGEEILDHIMPYAQFQLGLEDKMNAKSYDR